MKFYKITDGNWTYGYYLNKENARKRIDKANENIEMHKDDMKYGTKLSTAKWYVRDYLSINIKVATD